MPSLAALLLASLPLCAPWRALATFFSTDVACMWVCMSPRCKSWSTEQGRSDAVRASQKNCSKARSGRVFPVSLSSLPHKAGCDAETASAAFKCQQRRLQALAVAVVVITEIALSGASMDPTGAFAGAYFAGDYTMIFEVYFAASMAGAALAGLVWRYIQTARSAKKTD
eukprot:6205066-Pleurochrysis_carterae.AAC.5